MSRRTPGRNRYAVYSWIDRMLVDGEMSEVGNNRRMDGQLAKGSIEPFGDDFVRDYPAAQRHVKYGYVQTFQGVEGPLEWDEELCGIL